MADIPDPCPWPSWEELSGPAGAWAREAAAAGDPLGRWAMEGASAVAAGPLAAEIEAELGG